jgi:hypothetical protein
MVSWLLFIDVEAHRAVDHPAPERSCLLDQGDGRQETRDTKCWSGSWYSVRVGRSAYIPE